jgi:hypothetical protein
MGSPSSLIVKDRNAGKPAGRSLPLPRVLQ